MFLMRDLISLIITNVFYTIKLSVIDKNYYLSFYDDIR